MRYAVIIALALVSCACSDRFDWRLIEGPVNPSEIGCKPGEIRVIRSAGNGNHEVRCEKD
jgi:hypothetical protein